MRILIAPDAFKGTLDAPEVADAIARGWLSARPDHDVLRKPMSDGGPGFVRGIAAALDAPIRTVATTHSLGAFIDAEWCMHAGTAYIEAAQAVGIDRGTDVLRASSAGMAPLLTAALQADARRIVVGLGGSNVNDAGAGMLAALGALATDAQGAEVPLLDGPRALTRVHAVDLSAVVERFREVELVVASDVDVPLLGARGATHGFAEQKGAVPEQLPMLEFALANFSRACGRRSDGKDAAVMLGAGAAGGLGFALMRLGATRASGFEAVWSESGISLDGVDLVITGEGRLDWQSMRGKVVSGVAAKAAAAAIPVIALAGSVTISARERSEMGLDAAYSVSEFHGMDAALADAASCVAASAARLTRTWG